MMATHIQRTLLCGHEKHRLSNPARGVCSCSVQHVYNVRPSRVYTQMYKNEMSAVWNGDVGCLTQRCQLVEIERSAIWNKAARPTLDVRPPKTAVWKQSCQTHPGCQTSQNSCLETKLSDLPWVSDLPKQLSGNKAVRPTLGVRPPKTAVWKQSCQTHPVCQTS